MSNRSLFRTIVFSVSLSGFASAQVLTITTFDAPGAGTGFRQGTTATGINSSGSVGGFYVDPSGTNHGFIRDPSGNFTTFNMGDAGSLGTLVYGINDSGAVSGYYFDTSSVSHGFMRSRSGQVTSFDPPASTSTYAYRINASGEVTGFYITGSISESFVWSASNGSTVFLVPGSGGTGLNGTRSVAINAAGEAAGWYSGLSTKYVPDQGFLRDPSGAFTTFNAGSDGPAAVVPYSINDSDEVTGTYVDHQYHYHGFLRNSDGAFTNIDVPGISGTEPFSINSSGAVTGYCGSGTSQGFVRSASGVFTTFSVPGSGGAAYSGTFPNSINDSGVVAGYYTDANSTNHGFLMTP